MLEIVERWEKTGLLRGIAAEHKAEMSFVLQNQLYHNSLLEESSDYNKPKFMRLSVPLARRVYPLLRSHEKYDISARPHLESCLVVDLGVDGGWSKPDPDSPYSLDKEAAETSVLADKIRDAVDRFVETQVPFNTFCFQCLGTTPSGSVTLYYDLD